MTQQDDRIREWLDQGWGLLNRGVASQARDVFDRVLLLDPASEEARRGTAAAAALCGEATRLGTECLHQAEAAWQAGDGATARRLAEEVIAQGGDRDRAHALLDRLEQRQPRLEQAGKPLLADTLSRIPLALPGGRTWSRKALLGGWAVLFGLLLGGVASSFEGLLARLERAPVPAAFTLPPTTALSQPNSGEQTVAAARQLLDQGEAAAAVALLRGVKPAEPAYPFAQQLLGEARAELGRRKGGR